MRPPCRLSRTPYPSKYVFPLCHNLYMGGIYTTPIAAEMVGLEPSGNWPDKKFVCEAVGRNLFPIFAT